MSEQMREEFEAWYLEKYCGGSERLKRCHNDNDTYYYSGVQAMWTPWEASRASAQATIAQQAQMIEHLRGGPTPLYTAVDMANAARDGFRDGVDRLKEAYLAGWDASGEGYNAEHPCDAHEKPRWVADRDKAIEEIMQQVKP